MFTTRPELTGTFGMVASTHWLASATGMGVLERGGNAVDAAVTAGFVLQVVEPHMNGPAGDVPILVADPSGQVQVYCGQGPAPAAATISRFLDQGLDVVPGTGLLAAVVPGAFGAWMQLLEDRGTWSVRDVLEPAISYATDGYPLPAGTTAVLTMVEELFRAEWPTSATTYLTSSGPPLAGSRFRNPALAASYGRIIREAESAGQSRDRQIEAARAAFYSGFVAEEMDAFCATQEVMDTSGSRHRGLLTGADLACWRLTVEDSVSVDHAGLTIHKAGPWSQGPVLLQLLQLLAGFDLEAMGHLSVEWVHAVLECLKLAFADREAWYGDPATVDVPLDTLLSATYADQRRQAITREASFELRPGRPDGREPRLPRWGAPIDASARGAGEPAERTSRLIRGDTCHLDVVDRDGMMVSATPSGGWLQSSPVIPALGFCLGTRGQMFSLEPGLPNSLAPGKRPRTTLTPSLATRDGRPYLAFGTPGGDQQDQWSLSFLLAHVHAGLDLQAAIDAPMFHSTHFPSSFFPHASAPGHVVAEDRLGPDVLRGLRDRGHLVDVVDGWSLGYLSAVRRDERTGFLSGAANARGMQGYAIGR